MRQERTKSGYLRVEIRKKHFLIHRLVYQAWSDEELKDGMVIDHIDANPQNNNIENLRQVTQKENIGNAIEHGNFGRSGCRKLRVYDDITKTEKIYESIRDFLTDIGAPDYMIAHGAWSTIRKRREYDRYHVFKIDEH